MTVTGTPPRLGPRFLLWVDLEATGLDFDQDDIIEIGAILTTPELVELDRFHAVIRPSDAALARLLVSESARSFHEANGLLKDCTDGDNPSVYRDLTGVEDALLRFLDSHDVPSSIRATSVCGSGVGHFDIPFLTRRMPRLMRRCRYFAAVDVGVLRRSYQMWTGERLSTANEGKNHRATTDIACHLEEARAFRSLFVTSGAPHTVGPAGRVPSSDGPAA